MNKNNPRLLAVKSLNRIQNGAYSNLQLNYVIDHSEMQPRDTRLFTNIVYGVIQNRITLEYYTKYFVKKFKKVKPWVKELLYTAIYQMYYLSRIPNRAIFNESIKIAKIYGNDGTRRMITGTLHNIARKGLPDINKIEDEFTRNSIKYSVPIWLIKELYQQVGAVKTTQILNSINQPARQSVRVNTSQTSQDKLIESLNQEGFDALASKISNDGVIISNKSAINSEEFRDGMMTFQDESAMLPVQSMPIQSDSKVLDACSAPGGKTTQIAERLNPDIGGQVIALDLHQSRLNQVNKNAKRMHLTERIQTKALDARLIDNEFINQTFDQILVDAPCSGLGLIRRKPEVRYEKSKNDTLDLSKIQLNLLQRIAPKLKVGGTITYSTCTILDQENSEVINQFLKSNPNFKIIPINSTQGTQSKRQMNEIKLYPDEGSDGFFICNLIRKY